MNFLTSAEGLPRTAGGQRLTRLLIGLGAVAGGACLGYLVLAGHIRTAIVVTGGMVLLALARMRIQTAVIAAVIYLVFMGDLRRLLIPLVGWSNTDPLLLLGPIFAILLFGYAVASGSLRLNTKLAWWMAAFMGLMLLQIFNPQQGGLMVGVAGVMFYLVPLLWFWIGRAYASASFMKTLLFKVVVPLAVLAAAMGYYQTFFGYLPYQMAWYKIAGYTALGSLGIQAPISFFSSHTAYAVFLNVAMVAVLALMIRKRQFTLLPLFIVLFVALFLTGIRGPVARLLFTAAGMWAVTGRNKKTWILRGAFAVALGIAGLLWSLSQVGSIDAGARVQHRVTRQAEGFLNATEEGSSAAVHLNMIAVGLTSAFRNPLGYGLGATTKAANKFGGNMRTSESDIGDIALSLGIIGLLIYLVIIYLVFSTAVRHWAASRNAVSLAVLGILAITFFSWLQGGRYAIYPVIWLCIGWVDRAATQKQDAS